MADWKNVHLAGQDERIAELEMERAECQHELVALRYTLDDLVAHQRRRAEVAEARVREMEAENVGLRPRAEIAGTLLTRTSKAEKRCRELEATIDAMAEAHAHDDQALTAAYLNGAHAGKKQAEAERDALRERCEKLEWLVEVQDLYMYRLRNPGGWSTPDMERAKIGVAWQRRSAANAELRAIYIAATEVKS